MIPYISFMLTLSLTTYCHGATHKFLIVTGHEIESAPLSVWSVDSEDSCLLECVLHENCTSALATQDRTSVRCELYDTVYTVPLIQHRNDTLFLGDMTSEDWRFQSPCPSPQMTYVETIQQCYHFGAVNMGEAAAMMYCTDLYPGTRLASVLSQQEQDAIEGLLAGQTGKYLTSGRRPAGGGRYDFVWSDSGEDMVYRNFYSGQPYRGSANHDCVLLLSGWGWQWNDGDCLAGAKPLCKYHVLS